MVFFLMLLQDSLANFVHDFVGMSGTSGVHSLASLRSDHTANEGGQIKFNAGCSDINGISLTESFGNDHFILLRSKKKGDELQLFSREKKIRPSKLSQHIDKIRGTILIFCKEIPFRKLFAASKVNVYVHPRYELVWHSIRR